MLKPTQSHQDYLDFLSRNLPRYFKIHTDYLLGFVHRMVLLDLSNLSTILLPLYSNTGAPAIDPTCLFRSLILMTLNHESSIDKWRQLMDSFPLWAVLSGFPPAQIPGTSTFRDFISRLWLFEEKEFRKDKSKRLRKTLRKPKKKLKNNEKLPPKHPGIVGRLAQRLLAGKDLRLIRPDAFLNTILKDLFVLPSAKLNLLGDINRFAVSGDGSIIPTGASPFGIRTCDCKSKGIYRCNCPKIFTDLHASWGWDSHNEKWVFGHTLYEITAANSFHNLPIFLMMPSAKRHDSVSGLVAFFDCFTLYHDDLSFSEFLGDSAHDAYPFYELLDHFDIEALIDLNKRSKNFNLPQFKVNQDGKTVYTKCSTDLRLFTRTPRHTNLWKQKFKRRSGSERSFKRKLYDYDLEHTRTRGRGNLCWRYFLAAFCQHLDAWVIHSSLNISELVSSWMTSAA